MENTESGILRVGNLIVTSAVTDALLARAYLNYVKEGTLPIIFYQAIPTISQFIAAYMEPGKHIVQGCFRVEGDASVTFCGLGWCGDCVKMGNFTKADVGIGMFRCAGKDNLAFGKLMFEQFFSHHRIDVIFGCTPEPNRLALRYAAKLGMTMSHPIDDYCTWHGKLCAAVISKISREQWLERGGLQTYTVK